MLLSLQMYTVRRLARADLSQTLYQTAQAGYAAIEAARVPLTRSTLTALEQARTEYGLITHSFQLKYKQLADTAVTLPFLQRAGCRVAVVAALPFRFMHADEQRLAGFYKGLNMLGAQYNREGICLAYHHHDFEAVRFGDRRGFDVLDNALDYNLVKLVCDTYWLQKSGYCPQLYILRHAGAVAGVHLRDYGVRGTALLPVPADCSLGEGMLDISAVLQAAQQAGASYCAVEQNSRNPLEDIAKSMNYLIKLQEYNFIKAERKPGV